MKKKVEKALEYANATNKIENNEMSKEELKEIKQALEENKESFLYRLVERLQEKNGKTKWGFRLWF